MGLCLSFLLAMPAEAKKKKEVPPVKKEVRTPARQGLFNVQYWKDKYYFQIPDSLLGRLFMVANWPTSTLSILKRTENRYFYALRCTT